MSDFFTYDKNRLKAMDFKGKIHLFVIEKIVMYDILKLVNEKIRILKRR